MGWSDGGFWRWELFERSRTQGFSIQGVEFSGDYLLDRNWALYENFCYAYGKNLETNAPLSRVPPTQGILGLRWRSMNPGDYFAVYTWMSDRQDRLDPVRDVADERIPIGGTPGFATLNARMGKVFGAKKLQNVSVSLVNITDKAYLVHRSGVLGTGFTARFGYNWLYRRLSPFDRSRSVPSGAFRSISLRVPAGADLAG